MQVLQLEREQSEKENVISPLEPSGPSLFQ